MVVVLRAQEISKNYGTQTLFEALDLSIENNERLGIIGPNGVGKSTLMRILAGLEPPDEGEIIPRKGLRMAYVPQISSYPAEDSVLTIVERAAHEAGLTPEDCLGSANVVLGKVGFADPEQKAGSLSGGWIKRLTLACGLVGDPDLVLFDEPTNHLDTRGVIWLEELLGTASFAWVLITHDRAFLDRTAHRIAELNPAFPEGIFSNEGDYRNFQTQRAAFLEAQAQYIDALSNKVRRETEWLRAGVKARTTKSRSRIDAAHLLIGELEVLRRRTAKREANIAFTASERQTRKLIEVKGLTKRLGDRTIVRDFDYVLSPRKRIGLLGTNGTGKTTFLRLLLGELPCDAGSVHHAPNLQAVYFDQSRSQLSGELSLREALSPTGGESVVYQDREVHLLSWAKRFNFAVDQLPLPVSRLSGGEQARLLISRLMLQPADVLLLDEPTNDLDIPTLEMLEETLLDFPGALVLVTHDRYMLERICTHFIGLDGQGDIRTYGDYRQWEDHLRQQEKARTKPATTAAKTVERIVKAQKKLGYMEQREWEGMEEAILEAETRLEACHQTAADPNIASDGARLIAAHEALTEAEAEVARLYDRWTELSEKLAALNA